MTAPLSPPPARRRGGGILLAVLGIPVVLFSFYWGWKRPLSPSGGLYFASPVVLDVPAFRQNDPRWGRDPLGATPSTLGAEGCAVSSAAMVLSFYGAETDPQRLNRALTGRGGYTPQGWLYWEKAAWAAIPGGTVQKAYEDLPSYFLIDWNLRRGNPVIVRLRLPGGTTHFVVVVGKRGWDYLIRDPGGGAAKGVYPLRELGSPIYGLRFYRQVPKGRPT